MGLNLGKEPEFAVVNGKRLFAFPNEDELIKFTLERKGILIAMNAKKISLSDTALDEIINNGIGYTDGVGAILALKRKKINSVKIAGVDLWIELLKNVPTSKIFLIGARHEINEIAGKKLLLMFPDVVIVGMQDGYFSGEGLEKLRVKINETEPDIVFVAMGSPKQEYIMEYFRSSYPKALYMGLGGSLDVFTGSANRAPACWIKLNLEWAYRFIHQPRRLLENLYLIRFIFSIIMNIY